jgi:hypothetical protein
MTYNQVITEIKAILATHAMIKSVKVATPREWLFKDSQPIFPIACVAVNSGSLNVGREQVYNISLWFLDKAGLEGEFEQDVTSDQLQTCADIISKLRNGANDWQIDDNITYNLILDKFEDYLSGVEISFNMTTYSDFDACDIPLNP